MDSSKNDSQDTAELVSIGHLADATGISIDTIRVWERRYGRPVPTRLPSGHRRYAASDVTWLRRISEGLARGFRPSKLVKLAPADLDLLLGDHGVTTDDDEPLARRLKLVRTFQGNALRDELDNELLEHGIRDVIHDYMGPLITAVGRAWADGELEVRHEHFLTEILEDFLRFQRSTLRQSKNGPIVVFSSLAGEPHSLGIQMAAMYAVLAGSQPHLLGPDMPNEEIVMAAIENNAQAVAISISLASGGVKTDRQLEELRKALPQEIELVVGGRGARGVRRGVRGVHYSEKLGDFEAWLRELK